MAIDCGSVEVCTAVGYRSPAAGTHKTLAEVRIVDPDSDVDADGRADLLTIDPTGTAKVSAGKVSGFKSASPVASQSGKLDTALLDGTGHYMVDTADVTGDRHADLITMKGSGGIFVHPGKADGGFEAAIQTGTNKPTMNGTGTHEPIAAADVTGDGKADWIEFDETSDGFAVMPGKSDGTFGSAVASQNGELNTALLDNLSHYFLGAADVTGDGIADIVSVSTNGMSYVFKGQSNGSGKFEGSKQAGWLNPIMDDGSGLEPIGLGDVDRDRRADLLTLEGSTLKLRLGKSDATFGEATTAYSGSVDSALLDGTGEELVGLLDYSRDGLADLVSVKADGTLLTYTANRDKTFAAPVTQEGDLDSIRGLRPNGLEFVAQPLIKRQGCAAGGCRWYSRPVKGSTIGDGKPNLVTLHSAKTVFNWGGNVIGAPPGPTQSFKEAFDPALLDGVGHYAVDVADVTGEGRSDLITMETDGGLRVHAGNPDRSFAAGIESHPTFKPRMSGGSVEPFAVAETTGDGRADLITFFETLDSFIVAPGKADGSFENGTLSLNGTLDTAVIDSVGHYFTDAADVTGDGLADAVSINTNGNAYVFKSNGNGTFASPVTAAAVNPIMDNGAGQEPIGLGDVTGDGRADLLTLDGTTLKLWAGKEDGTFAAATNPYGSAVNSNLMDGTGEELLGLFDQNRDGRADLISINSTGTGVLTYVAQSNATFAAPTTTAVTIPSIRGTTTGHEFAYEKPMVRRAGCAVGGCTWP